MSSIFKQFVAVSIVMQMAIGFLAWVFMLRPEVAVLGGLILQVIMTSLLISELKDS